MRRLKVGLVIVGMFLSMSSTGFAQGGIRNHEMTERINALRNRLQNYQIEQSVKSPQSSAAETPASELIAPDIFESAPNSSNAPESVEISYEKLVDEFESRSDVAVTVLFHDPEFDESVSMDASFDEAADEKQMLSAAETEKLKREELYRELLQKVHSATRRSHNDNNSNESMMAQLPQ